MPAPKQLDPGQSPLHWFGAEFRRARERANMSQGSFAATVPCDISTVSRVEGGLLTPNGAFVEAIRSAFPEHGWLIRFYEASLAWGNSGPVPAWFEEWLRTERIALALCYWQPIIIPGLFQTAEYARTLLRAGHVDASDEHIDELVAARLARRAIFDKPEPPDVTVVIDELTLRRLVGSPKIMHDQLTELAELSEHPHISIQVLPSGYGYMGTGGALNIAHLDGSPNVVHTDAVPEGQTTEQRTCTRKAVVAFDRIRGDALPRGASRELILKLAEELWNT